MKQYLIRFPRNFANEYTLCWVEKGGTEAAQAMSEGFEPISRKNAIEKCVHERWARKHDQAFSGYGNSIILPYRFIGRYNAMEARAYLSTTDGYIYE